MVQISERAEKEMPWIRVFHFWGTGSYLSCREREPRSNGSGLLRASQPGTAASVRPSRPENDTLYVFCCAPASRTLRVLPAQGPERGVSDRKRKRTPCGVLFLLGSGSYLDLFQTYCTRLCKKSRKTGIFQSTVNNIVYIKSCRKVARSYF